MYSGGVKSVKTTCAYVGVLGKLFQKELNPASSYKVTSVHVKRLECTKIDLTDMTFLE